MSERVAQEHLQQRDPIPLLASLPVPEQVESGSEELVVEEPPSPRRVRRPVDLARFVLAVAACGAVLVFALVATATTSGIETDLNQASSAVPGFLVALAKIATALVVLVLPVVLAIDQVRRGQGIEFLHALSAGVLALLVALSFNAWAIHHGPRVLVAALTRSVGHGQLSPPTLPLLAALVAMTSVIVLAGRSRFRALVWGSIWIIVVTALLASSATPLAAVLTLSLGRAVGMGVRYAFGAPNLRPDGRQVASALRRMRMEPKVLRLSDREAGEARVYSATLVDGRRLEVEVYDRDQQGAGLLYRVYRRVRVREAVQRRDPLSLRQAVDHETLMAYAAVNAGVATPRLLAVTDVGPDAALLAYERPTGVPIRALHPGEISEAHLDRVWEQLHLLRSSDLAHRDLTTDAVLVAADGSIHVRNLASGEIAASDLQILLDTVDLLAALALVVGPDRAVDSAMRSLTPEELAATVPLLQPIALARSTRAALRKNRELLRQLRERLVELTPPIEVPPADLERVKPRTLVTIVAGSLGAYFLLSQLGSVNLVQIVTGADWGWGSLTLVFSALTYVGAAMIIMGFVPEKLQFVRTFLVQVAASFASLIAPAAVGGVAVNARYVQRSGVEPPVAVASVGVAQVSAFAIHMVLLLVFGVITGSSTSSELVPSQRVLIVVAVILALAVLALLLPPVRRVAWGRLQPTLTRVIPRLLDVLQKPSKLALGLSGNLLLNLAYIGALDASIRAFGGSLSFSTIGVVYLAGSALGSAAPTPGGLGAVEAALAAGLTAAGLTGDVAVSAVLLFRLATFWLPVLPGYLAFGWLQRRGAL